MTLVNSPVETLDYVTGSGIATSASAGTETAVLSTDVVQAAALNLPPAGVPSATIRPVTIEANINVTPGTSTTSVTIRCRAGVGTGGAQIGPAYVHTVGAQATQLHCKWRDTGSAALAAAGSAYTVTISQAGVTVAGAVNNIDIEVKQ